MPTFNLHQNPLDLTKFVGLLSATMQQAFTIPLAGHPTRAIYDLELTLRTG